MRFENTQVFNFDGAFRGMRNPKNSWERADSIKIYDDGKFNTDDERVQNFFTDYGVNFIIGENDMKLAKTLISGGAEHRKFLQQIFVSVDITAPLYWWKEADTYKVGAISKNSTSTMHKIHSKPITMEDFEVCDYNGFLPLSDEGEYSVKVEDTWQEIIWACEKMRQRYVSTKDKLYWKELIRMLPESYLQKRTMTMSYENAYNMYKQRCITPHKLVEWRVIFKEWCEELPWFNELFDI